MMKKMMILSWFYPIYPGTHCVEDLTSNYQTTICLCILNHGIYNDFKMLFLTLTFQKMTVKVFKCQVNDLNL